MNKKYLSAVRVCILSIALLFSVSLSTTPAFAADTFSASGNVSLNYDGPVSTMTSINTSDNPYYLNEGSGASYLHDNVIPIAPGQTVTDTLNEDDKNYYVYYEDKEPFSIDFIKFNTLTGAAPTIFIDFITSQDCYYQELNIYRNIEGGGGHLQYYIEDAKDNNLLQDNYDKEGNGLYLVEVSAEKGDCTYSFSVPGLEDAEVSFATDTLDAAVPASVYTDSAGAWSQTGFTTGAAYTVTVSKPGYTITSDNSTISDSSNTVSFTAAPVSYPSIISAESDTAALQCTSVSNDIDYLSMGNVVNLTVETSGLADGTRIGAFLLTSQKAQAIESIVSGGINKSYGLVDDNKAVISMKLNSGLRPGRYDFMIMIPGLAKPAYVPLTLLRSDGMDISDSDSLPSITDITLSSESMSNKQSGVVTVNIKTANVPSTYVIYSNASVTTKYNTTCNVALLRSDGSAVAGFDWRFADNAASVPLNVPTLPAGSYKFKITVNSKTYSSTLLAPLTLDTPLVAYKDFTVYDAATSNDITGFTVPGQTGTSVIDSANHTVSFSMPYGSDVTAFKPEITINGASVSPLSGAAVDFTAPVTYTVTAQNGMRQKWTVACSVYAESSSYKTITAYNISGQTGDSTIDAANRTVTLEMPDSSDLSNLTASFTASAGASLTVNGTPQTSGSTSNSFRTPLEYTVTAEDGSKAVWTVYVICNTRQFELSGGSLDQTSGVTASVTASPTNGLAHDGNEMVVFQLMKGDVPIDITAIKRDILKAQQVQAHFDVEGSGYSVKVFLFDQLTYESGNTQINLAEPVLLK